MADQVTPQGVSLLLGDSVPPTPVVVQVLDLKSIANNRYTCMVTDGKTKAKAMLPTNMAVDVETGKIQDLGLIRIHSFTSSVVSQNKVLIVTSCEAVHGALESERGSLPNEEKLQPVQAKSKIATGPIKSAAQIVQEEHGRAAPAARMGASRRVYPLMSLTPYQGNWTIKVRVTSKGPLRTYKNARGEGSVFNVELTDEDGTQIQATMFKEAADKFYQKFEMGKVYYISKGVLRVANRQFSTVKNDYEMTLNASSEVEEVFDAEGKTGHIPVLKYNFVKIEDMGAQVNKKELFDVIGVLKSVSSTLSVRRKSDNTEFAKRDVVIVDQSLKTVTVSLWSSLAVEEGAKMIELEAEAPVVLIRAVRASDFQGVSLSTTTNSMVWINPDVPEAQELRSWYDEFGKEAKLIPIGSGLGNQRGSRSAYDDRAELREITSPSVGEGKPAYFSVRACISYIKPDQTMFYMACNSCNRKVTEDNSRYWCEACQQHFDSCNRRYLLLAKISDSTGEAWVSFFNDQAEQVLGVSADRLAEMKSQEEEQYSQQLKNATWLTSAFRVSVAQTEYMGEKRQRITVRSVTQIDWAAESALLLEKKLSSYLSVNS